MKLILHILGRIKGLLLLHATLLLSAVFTVFRLPRTETFPDDDPDTSPFFLWSDYEVTDNTYWYFGMEHLILVLFASYILYNGRDFITALQVFLFIQFIDLLDYVLVYGEIWFYASTFPVSWNVLKAVIFTLAIAAEVLTILERRLQNE